MSIQTVVPSTHTYYETRQKPTLAGPSNLYKGDGCKKRSARGRWDAAAYEGFLGIAASRNLLRDCTMTTFTPQFH